MSARPPVPSADPAFPHETERSSPSGAGVWTEIFHGLSRREWFAGHALAGILAGVEVPNYDVCAEMAFEAADAMIAESQKMSVVSDEDERQT